MSAHAHTPSSAPAPVQDARYERRRAEVETYFDRTAVQAWERLTSDEPVGRIRASVRAGRDQMRGTLLSWLPADLRGLRLLDAGCGTGALAVEAARRGAEVVAIDLSPTLVELARSRQPVIDGPGHIEFRSGDMLDAGLGRFDHVVCMDSLIHYDARDVVAALGRLAPRCRGSVLFTFAPSTPVLAVFKAVGKLFPRGNRSPSIAPVAEAALRRGLAADPVLAELPPGRTRRVASGFYTSQALELVRS
ncbi:magnesium protoporphyrin IX methyltransferase [Leptothrix discophora]|uniref:Magnesium protoporphyrin IX methyltransferase n=1 Tax=Leptothrix discophora TaxID=89 RepID=A0ABT9G4F5_LEPDI|nr:magnesium protoporphyrin IX methyltransferase [Leptothrix discophora]MDP4301372.1 magnesium protoporphyrin IX methyltransferase [Leptothrix discophora]